MSPRIAVIASQGATDLCQANHLPSLVDLLKPFGEQIEGRGKNYSVARRKYPLLACGRVFSCLLDTACSFANSQGHLTILNNAE